MTMKSALIPMLLAASLSASAFAASPAARNQDDVFWANVQLTEGVTPAQTVTFPRAVRVQAAAPSDDFFALERQKIEGYTGDQPAANEQQGATLEHLALRLRQVFR